MTKTLDKYRITQTDQG